MAMSRLPRPSRRARLLALLVVPLLSTTVLLAPAPATLAGPLSDARARQQDLQRQVQEQQAKVAQLARQESSVGAQFAATRASLDGVNTDLAATKAQVAGIAQSIAEVQATYDGLVQKIASLDAQPVEVQAQEARKAEELASRKAQLAARVRDAYEADRTSMLEIILSSGTFTDLVAEAGHQMDMAGRDRDLAERVRQDQAVLASPRPRPGSSSSPTPPPCGPGTPTWTTRRTRRPAVRTGDNVAAGQVIAYEGITATPPARTSTG